MSQTDDAPRDELFNPPYPDQFLNWHAIYSPFFDRVRFVTNEPGEVITVHPRDIVNVNDRV